MRLHEDYGPRPARALWLDQPVPGTRLLTRPFLLTWASTFFLLLAIGTLLPVLPVYAKGPLGESGVGVGIAVAAASPTAFLLQPLAGRLGNGAANF